MANTASNVTAGTPKVAGAIYTALVSAGLILPTDTDAALPEGLDCVGYISEDGLKRSKEITSEKIKAWGGDTVMEARTANDSNFTFKMIEYLNKAVQQVAYGAGNVTGDLTAGMTIKDKPSYKGEQRVWVIDQIMTGGVKCRIVIPCGVVTALAEITYKDNEAVGYEATLGTIADATGVAVYEYLKKPAA